MASIPAIRARWRPEDFPGGTGGFPTRAHVDKKLQPTGIVELDEALGGGFPRGSLVELCGTSSSGRTGLCFALLAQATCQQHACAFVDVSDSLDPLSLAAANVDMPRLLWVRCGGEGKSSSSVFQSPMLRVSQREKEESGRHDSSFSSSAEDRERSPGGFIWRHPREQMRGIELSIPSVMRNSGQFTKCAEEQVERDRDAPRHGENVRRRRFPGNQSGNTSQSFAGRVSKPSEKPWKRLERALTATDLLLHDGGWGVVVLDFGNVSWVDVRRIPLSTWFRFQRIVEKTPAILLLLGEEPCARGCASLALRCRRREDKWRRAAAGKAGSGVVTLQGFEVEGEIMRSRTHLEHACGARWQTRSRNT